MRFDLNVPFSFKRVYITIEIGIVNAYDGQINRPSEKAEAIEYPESSKTAMKPTTNGASMSKSSRNGAFRAFHNKNRDPNPGIPKLRKKLSQLLGRRTL